MRRVDSSWECEGLRADLGLYAEGELRDPDALAHVRRHLASCEDCRDELAFQDALTRSILAAGAARRDSPARAVDAIMARLRTAPPPCSFRRTAPPPASPGRSFRHQLPSLPLRSAAAVLFGFVLASLLIKGTPEDPRLAMPGAPVPSRDLVSRDLQPAAAVSAPGGLDTPLAPGAKPRALEPGELRWLLSVLGDSEAPAPRVPAGPIRLYGVRDPARRALAAREVEWIVDAVAKGTPGSRAERYFLVPDFLAPSASGARPNLIEILPSAWFEPGAGGVPRRMVRPGMAAEEGGERPLFRVYVLRDPSTLRSPAPIFAGDGVDRPRHGLPQVLGESRRMHPFLLPANWGK